MDGWMDVFCFTHDGLYKKEEEQEKECQRWNNKLPMAGFESGLVWSGLPVQADGRS
jgi:hypothetical protein